LLLSIRFVCRPCEKHARRELKRSVVQVPILRTADVQLQQPLTIAYRCGELAVRVWVDAIAGGYSQSSNVLAGRDYAPRIRSVASINFEHVTKRYADGLEAVKDMNLAVADGEFMILVGPSGSGSQRRR
jgi:ABC-type multidrug transport system fused ATPase/permease subunit